jgi:hypothetical protein
VIFAIKESNFGIYVDWMHKRNLDDNTMVSERVFFFYHLKLVLKVSSTIDHLSVLMAYIYIGDMMRSY